MGQQLIIAAIPVLPALVFLVLALFGRYIKEGAQFVAIFGVATSLVFSCFALFFVTRDGQPIDFAVNWIDFGAGGSFQMGIYIDGLAAVMLVVVCFVSLMIQLYSGAFMQDDKRFAWYYAVLNLFTASMLGLVVAPNFIELYVFWELVGLCHILIVAGSEAWALKRPTSVYRDAVGDAALFLGSACLAGYGTTSYRLARQPRRFIGGRWPAAGCWSCRCYWQSAHFRACLAPDAMEGPTPVSAPIHAATRSGGSVTSCSDLRLFVQKPDRDALVGTSAGSRRSWRDEG